MALSEISKIDNIIINEEGVVMYRVANQIFKDDVKVAESFYRVSVVPGQNTADLPKRVAAVCNAVWTQETINLYNSKHNLNL